jgi:ferredoxin
MEAEKGRLKKAPSLDLSGCTDCESCIELYPDIFKKNKNTGCIEVADLSSYPEGAIEEAMAMCPGDCITWQLAAFPPETGKSP